MVPTEEGDARMTEPLASAPASERHRTGRSGRRGAVFMVSMTPKEAMYYSAGWMNNSFPGMDCQ